MIKRAILQHDHDDMVDGVEKRSSGECFQPAVSLPYTHRTGRETC